MKFAITGSTGLIGSALTRSLLEDGHKVVRLVRLGGVTRQWMDGSRGAIWEPESNRLVKETVEGLDGIVHLAGAGVGSRRWTRRYKRAILESRRQGTTLIAETLTRLEQPPKVLVSASAIGFYGQTGSQAVDETAPSGNDFLSEVCRVWEAATAPAEEIGVRVVHARTGLVFDRAGGAAAKLLPLFRYGLGGKLGSGRQFWSLISLADEVAAIRFLLDRDDISGPVNLTAPTPATNAEVTAELGRQLHRPTLLRVPSFALRIALGEMAREVTGSQRVIPAALQHAGFQFQHPELSDIVAAGLSGETSNPPRKYAFNIDG
ncbi:MAG: TIGR01777 family oxidoreductase [Arachnia sp.]